MIWVRICALLLANGAAAVGAGALLLRVCPERRHTDLVVFQLFRLLIISVVVILAGLTRTLTPAWICVASILFLGGIFVRGIAGSVRAPETPRFGRLAFAFAILVGVRLLFQAWYFAPHVGDALSYHLPKVAEWVRSGGFTRELGLDNHATFPAGFELIETWWVVFLRHDVLIEFAGVEMLVLGFAAVRSIGRQFGLSEQAASWAGLLYAMTPGVHLQATSCLNDGAVAALVLATISLILSEVPVGLVVVAAGLGIGVKPSYAYTLPGLALLLRFRGQPQAQPHPGRVLAGWAGAAGIATGLFWYVRNTVQYGNPIYPVTFGGLGSVPGERWIQLGPDSRSLASNLGALIGDRIFDASAPYGAYLEGISGWGPITFSAGAIALIGIARTDPALRRMGAAFLLSLASVLALVAHDPFCMRFTLFFPAVTCVAAARLSEENRRAALFVWMGVLASFFATLLPSHLPRGEFSVLASTPWQRRSASRFSDLDSMMSGVDAIAYMAEVRGYAYPLYRPDYSRRVVYVRAGTGREIVQLMRVERVTLLYTGELSPAQRLMLEECLTTGTLRRRQNSLYELTP